MDVSDFSYLCTVMSRDADNIIREAEGKRVAVLLSGGVDSSVVVHQLVEWGVRPDCFYIHIGPEEHEQWDCTAEEDVEMATAVARRYGLSFEVVDCHRDYWTQVTQYTMEQVKAGLTPNPDVMCNRLIKFGAFHRAAGHQYDLIATGHYARTEWADGHKWLCTSPDPVKDQTDFLAQIEGWQLQKALFPIGHMAKGEVRAVAERAALVTARRKDSQGICFLGKVDYDTYIRRYVGEKEGEVVELETGRVVGKHRGHWFHTIGQRKGLGLGGGPWFVVRKDVGTNTLFVSHGYDPVAAYRSRIWVPQLHWLTLPPEASERTPVVDGGLRVTIKIRHTPEWLPATLQLLPEGGGVVLTDKPVHGVAPGQFCVIYDVQQHRCLGSGAIGWE